MRWPWNSSVRSLIDHIGGTPRPRPWWRRNLPALATLLMVVIVAGGLFVWSQQEPPRPCGLGMVSRGSVCVGLDLDGKGFGPHDDLRSWEKTITRNNNAVTGSDFVTIVYLDDLVPNSDDIVTDKLQEHRIEGAIVAQQEVNRGDTNSAGSTKTKVKLLLANYGVEAKYQKEAVTAIAANQASQKIVAVTGVGESLEKTQEAVAGLTAHGIYTISATASGSKMNELPGTSKNSDFFRVVATNEDEAGAAVSYIPSIIKKPTGVVLIQDTNPDDDYASDLGTDFKNKLEEKYGSLPITNIPYESPGVLPQDPRGPNVAYQFSQKYPEICAAHPGLIYFAGRGADLVPFLESLSESCPQGQQLQKVTILSGDDFNNEVGTNMSKVTDATGIQVTIRYTAVATGGNSPEGMWQYVPPGVSRDVSTDVNSYKRFAADFKADFKKLSYLEDGHAIMEYDALLTATIAARNSPSVAKDPSNLRSAFYNFDCLNTPVPGAGGQIAFYSNGNPPASDPGNPPDEYEGDPIDKAVPIMQLNLDGSASQMALEWPDGGKTFNKECNQKSP